MKDCKVCGEGNLKEEVDDHVIHFDDCTITVPSYYSVCDNCGVEQASFEQSAINKRLALDAKAKVSKK